MAFGGLLIAGVAAGLARRVLFVVRIDGESMEPTFRPDDVVLAVRSRANPMIRRGDVVVCRLPAELQGPTGYLVKRVTAIAGDPVPCAEPVDPGSALICLPPAGSTCRATVRVAMTPQGSATSPSLRYTAG